jgi:histidine triad (HIT) family protein
MSEQSCLFCRIVAGEIPATEVYSDAKSVAFRDLNPKAPVHVLIVPRNHISSLSEMTTDDEQEIGHLLRVAGIIAQAEGIAETGYRTVINTGENAGQSVFHIHVHLLGGRGLAWPPG